MVSSTHLKLALAWINYVNLLAVDKMAPIMTDNFVSHIRPASLGFPEAGKQAYLDRLAASPITNFNISLPKPNDIVESNNTIMFYTNADGTSKHGFPWKNEYVFTITFEGDKISGTTEFVDYKVVSDAIQQETIVAQAKNLC